MCEKPFPSRAREIDASAGSTNNLIVNNTISQSGSSGAALEILNASTGNTIYNNILLGGADSDSLRSG